MKALLIITGLVLLQSINISAQEKTDPAKADTKKAPAMQVPVRTTVTTKRTVAEPQAQETPKPAPTSKDYRLTLGKVTIHTGNDNKEQPSHVQMGLSFGKNGSGFYDTPREKYKEFAVNSVTELYLDQLYLGYYPYEAPTLALAEETGVTLYISYTPNFPLDAWKIEKVVLTLEYRDGSGNLHPVLKSKEIVFTNVGALMNNVNRSLVCEADRFLMPTRAYIRKQ